MMKSAKLTHQKKTLSLCYLSLKIYHSSKTKKKRKDRKNVTKTVVCSKKIIEKKINPFELLKESITAKKSWISFIHWFDPKKDWLLHQLEQKKKKAVWLRWSKTKKKFAPPNFIARRKAGKIQPKSHSTTRLSRLRRNGFKDPDA